MDAEAGTIETGVLNAPDGRAMFVFRSEDEADRYRAETGDYQAAEGRGAVSLTPEHMRGGLEIHEVPRVVFPQDLKGGGRWVHFYAAQDFLVMLEAAPMFQDVLEN